MEHNIKLSIDIGTLLEDLPIYRCLIGRFIYLTSIRPDITYSVIIWSQSMHGPCQPHLHAAHCPLRYLNATVGQGLFYLAKNELQLTASCLMTCLSTLRYCILLGASPISWKIKKQGTVSHSSAEAEYCEMVITTCKISWLSYFLQDIGMPLQA